MKTQTFKTSLLKPLLIVLLLAAISPVFAQGNGGNKVNLEQRKTKLKSLKVAYITNKLALTPEEAEKFWPVYNEYQDKLMELRGQKVALQRNAKTGFESFSDDEIDNYLNQLMVLKQQELDLEKLYLGKIRQVLSARKVAQLLKAERDFKTEVLREYQNRQGGQKPGGQKP